jgi:signal transduction histidine kinase
VGYLSFKTFIKSITQLSISGHYEDFSLEHRLFNNLCAFSVVACLVTFVANALVGIAWQMHIVVFLLLCFFSYLYYLSRFRKRYKSLVIPYQIIAVISLSAMWFLNGGIMGPIGYFYFIAIVGAILFIKPFHIAIILMLGNFTILVFIDYFFPYLSIPYADRLSHYLDICVGVCTVALLISIGIQKLKTNYDLEHQKVEQQKQQLSQLNEIQSKLISIISHDVRSPLNSVKGTLRLLKSEALSKEEIAMLSERLSQEVDSTINLVNNLLYWSQNQLHDLQANPEKFDIRATIDENISLVSPQAQKKNVRIEYPEIQTVEVFADKEMIKTVLRNLLTNAIKFSYKNNDIHIKQYIKGKEVVIEVCDTGVGIPQAVKEQLFHLSRYTTLGTSNEKGNGIGLMLCKDFVEKNGGKIWVESEEGKGSRFFFTVPIYIS